MFFGYNDVNSGYTPMGEKYFDRPAQHGFPVKRNVLFWQAIINSGSSARGEYKYGAVSHLFFTNH